MELSSPWARYYFNTCILPPNVRALDSPMLMRQGSTTNPLIWKGNADYRKISLDYATTGRAFRNCFFFPKCFPCIHKYDDS